MGKTEHYYNKEKLVKVTLRLTHETDDYYYSKGDKFLGITVQKAGVYCSLFHRYAGKEAPDGYILMNGKIYQLPYVLLHYEAGHRLTRNFDTDKEAREFLHLLLKNSPFTQHGL